MSIQRQKQPLTNHLARVALRTSLLYGSIAAAWILLSDRLLAAIFSDPEVLSCIQTYKGLGFVLVTTVLLYAWLRSQLGNWEKEAVRRQQAEAEILRLNADLERRVEERTAELKEANRELDSFAYAVSHDLRAPLRAMRGFGQALVEDYGELLHGEARVYLEQITIASQRMGQLIDGLLSLSRSARGELRRDRIDLSALAERIRRELDGNEPERRVEWRIEPGLAAWGDAHMIELVVRNLLGNAWKYTAGGASPSIRLYAEDAGGTPLFCVADNGAGFDMAHAEKLFQPFQRLHRQDEFPGLGIGLATVQRIVHRHGGVVRAAAAPGRGATFYFSLPLGDVSERENP